MISDDPSDSPASPRLNDLGDLQIAVLHILWRLGTASVHQVVAELGAERPAAYTTILTVLRNLEKRGLAAHDLSPGTRMFLYRATLGAAEVRLQILSDLLTRLFDGSPSCLIEHLLEIAPLSDAEWKALDPLRRAANSD